MPIDPRSISRVGQTVNERLLDSSIRHAVHLERFKNREVQQVVNFLNKEVVPDLLKQTEARLKRSRQRGFDTGPWTTQRLREITLANHQILRTGLRQLGDKVESSMVKLALTEAEWQRGVLSSTLPIEINLSLPNSELLRSIVTSRPMEGRVLKQWFSGIATKTGEAITREIQVGIAAGESVDKIMARLRGASPNVFQNAFGNGTLAEMNRNARAVVRTAVNHTTTQAKEATYAANADVIKGVQMVATLDSRTTEICMGQDGKIYPIGEGPRPPFHFQCRTTTVPVTKSWQEMGIPLKDTKTVGARASMNGEVSAKLTYGDWLKRQPKDFQERVLGKQKAAMFRQGKVTVDQFTDSAGRVLTLEQLKTIDAADILSDFTSFVSSLTAPEKVVEIKRLISQLDVTLDANQKKLIRAKLRRLDPDWQKFRNEPTPPPPPLPPPIKELVIPPVTPPPVQPTINLPVPEPIVKLKSPQKTGAELRADVMKRAQEVNRERDKLLRQAGELKSQIDQDQALVVMRIRNSGGLLSDMPRAASDPRWSEYHRHLAEAEKLSRRLTNEVHDMLKVDDPIELNITVGPRVPPIMKSQLSKAEEFLTKVVSKNTWESRPRPVSAKLKKINGRAFARPDSIHLDPSDQVGTYVHEMGHIFEYRNQPWLNKTLAYLKKRAGDEPLRTLKEITGKNYGALEKAWKDRWDNPYTGKSYGNLATEITSMGLEWLHDDPVGFAKKDPEFFEFLLDLIRGNI